MPGEESPNPDTPFHRFASLAEAQTHPNSWVALEADSGGQFLLSLPAADVHCGEATLHRLLADLENITWGNGFDENNLEEPVDAQIFYWTDAHPGKCPHALLLHEELEVELLLRDQIARVLSGEQPRLQLPHTFPHNPVLSLKEARSYPRGRVRLFSGQGQHLLIDCAARIVNIDESGLRSLINDLDGWIDWPAACNGPTTDPQIFYARRDSPPSFQLRNADLRLETRLLHPLAEEIERVLRGLAARIGPRPRVHHLRTDRGEVVDITLLPGERFLCPVCASICCGQPPFLNPMDSQGKRIDLDDRSISSTPTLNICRTCHTHFGVSDFPGNYPGLTQSQIWEQRRREWLAGSTSRPSDLARVLEAFRWSPSSPSL